MTPYTDLFRELDAQIYETYHRARKTDPATSHAAAARAGEFAAGHASRILAALQDNGPSTADEIAHATGLTVVQVDRRLPEMQRSGIAAPTGETRLSASRVPQRVWKALLPAKPMRNAA